MEMSTKYVTPSGVACTKDEEKLIDSVRRVIRKWNKGNDDLFMMITPDYVRFIKKSAIEDSMAWVDENAVVAEEFMTGFDAGDS